jgi:hypothetical protein
MDAIGIKPVSIPSYPAPQPVAAPAPRPVAQAPVAIPVDVQVASAEQKRFEAVKAASQSAPNVYPLGDRTFTIFKDSSGQYVTRYYSMTTGKVSYVPEPETLKQSGTYSAPNVKVTV